MNRSVTNAIRFVLDECVPPLVRDTRWFMYPFFVLAYRGKKVREAMDFKRIVHTFTDDDYAAFYAGLDTISRNRATDLNDKCIRAMLDGIPADATSLLDVGCGRGYFLERTRERHPGLAIHGCDVVPGLLDRAIPFTAGRIESLPFADQSFDVVTCSHTLEHILRPQAAILELRRVAKRVLFVVVPRQRYYFYTLDEHVNFYPHESALLAEFGAASGSCRNLGGDWFYREEQRPRAR